MGRVEPQDAHDEVVLYSEPKRGIYKKLVVRDDRLIGAILLGDTGKAAYLLQAFDRNTPLPAERAALLFDIGGAAKQDSIVDMPDDSPVCNCNGVSKGTIRQCIANGKRSLTAVMAATRAGMGCGSCKSRVQELVTFYVKAMSRKLLCSTTPYRACRWPNQSWRKSYICERRRPRPLSDVVQCKDVK